MKREQVKAITEWQQVPNVAIEKALKLNVPNGVFRKLKSSKRDQEIKEWRNVAIFCFWINGATTTEVMERFGRTHSTFNNCHKQLMYEIEGFKKCDYIERIRLINYYAKNRIAYCDEDSVQIGDLVVYYRSEFEPADEECGIIGGWAVDIVEVHGIIESQHIKGGVVEVPINDYDEQSLINAIKNKL